MVERPIIYVVTREVNGKLFSIVGMETNYFAAEGIARTLNENEIKEIVSTVAYRVTSWRIGDPAGSSERVFTNKRT